MKDKNKQWIKLYYSMSDHYLWSAKPFSKGQAWIDLLLLANNEDTKKLTNGRLIHLSPGTINNSIMFLANRWGWNRKTVSHFLSVLEKDDMLIFKPTTHGTTIIIKNYELYQRDDGREVAPFD